MKSSSFNFEKNLSHQSEAVKAVMGVFDGVELIQASGVKKEYCNPVIDTRANFRYSQNIGSIQEQNSIERNVKGKSLILDVMMETGTGKTYTYIKTIFELNKQYGIFKFVIVVPTLPIKAGTVSFIKSESAIEHFKEQFGKTINLHIVESKNGKKSYMPQAVSSFVNAGSFEKNKIQVLLINGGMINSKTMQQSFDRALFDHYTTPFEAISATRPFVIIDEPHKFGKGNVSWQNIQKMNPQIIVRYGATFEENDNLIYNLTAVDSFNKNLVKGVIGHITEFEGGKNASVRFTNSDGTEANFSLVEGNERKTFKLSKNESLEKIHPAMTDLIIEKLNKTTVVLSNGLELTRGMTLNPYSYNETLQETMIKSSIRKHFELERGFLTREVKIKPLTLFFIDNIDEYRNKDGYIKKTVEKYIKAEVEKLLKSEKDSFYIEFLEKTLKNVSKTHGGYFAIDKKETDEEIENQVNEILHDKQALLDLENTRRFIFSKWTLKEGWDNPNIFQICKLRSSGSEISKLQEVGRGLRLPVNQYGNRVKSEQFYLNYFVDFTENDFVDRLVSEINQNSGAISSEDNFDNLSSDIIKKICEVYQTTEELLLEKLDNDDVIKRNNDFKENGFEYIKNHYPLIFVGVDSNQIRKATTTKKMAKIRVRKYAELKELWEKLNQKVVLEYKIKNEDEFKQLFIDFLRNNTSFSIEGIKERTSKIDIEDRVAVVNNEYNISENDVTPLVTMRYDAFITQLAQALNINLKTIHKSFVKTNIEIDKYLNQSTLRVFKQKFDKYLLYNAINKFGIEYQKVTNTVHPTKFTDTDGNIRDEISASDVGMFYSEKKVPKNYFFDDFFYDSGLEKSNIETNISDVVVFTKIPKNSIKIPVAGGKTYSPDFAYVLNYADGNKKLYFVVETKDTTEDSLREEEEQKIKYAEQFFGNAVKVKFVKQFDNQKIESVIRQVYG